MYDREGANNADGMYIFCIGSAAAALKILCAYGKSAK